MPKQDPETKSSDDFKYSSGTRTVLMTSSGWNGAWKPWRGNRALAAERSHAAVTEAHRRPTASQPKEENNAS